jgi:ribonuclease P protein component
MFQPERVCATVAISAETPSGTAMNTPLSSDSQSRQRSQRQSLTGARLRKHADYQRAYAASRKRQSASMSWFLAPQQPASADLAARKTSLPAGPRIGLTAGKVLGKAHERNRIKRRMREALRRHLDLLPKGCDLIFHPRRFVLTIEFAKLEAEIVRILQQASAEARRMAAHPAAQPAPAKPAL